MADTAELLGALLRRGMTDSSASRIEHSLSDEGGLAEILEKELGVSATKSPVAAQSQQPGPQESTSSGPLGAFPNLGKLAKSLFGGGKQEQQASPGGGLGGLAGVLLGGGSGKSEKGASGGGALALLGSIALKALLGASQQKQGVQELDSATRLTAGLRRPENPQEEKEVESVMDLTVRAMINAAKADGRIDEDEFQKVVGELQEDGITQEERDYLLGEVRKPMSTKDIVREVPNRQVAAQVYAASLLAIEVDTPAERAYLQQLARDLGLDSGVVNNLHATLGLA